MAKKQHQIRQERMEKKRKEGQDQGDTNPQGMQQQRPVAKQPPHRQQRRGRPSSLRILAAPIGHEGRSAILFSCDLRARRGRARCRRARLFVYSTTIS